MSKRRSYVAVAGVALAVALSLGLVYGVFQAQPGATTGEEPVVASTDGAQDGIQVHGHWTIEVREPDGTLVSRQEFDNAFVDAGNRLPLYLARLWTVGDWQIDLWNTDPNQSPFLGYQGQRVPGMIMESTASPQGTNIFKNLTVDAPTSGPNDRTLVLSGTATAGINGTINEVRTRVNACTPDIAPSDCSEGLGGNVFTLASIPDVVVDTGYQILAQVVISFS